MKNNNSTIGRVSSMVFAAPSVEHFLRAGKRTTAAMYVSLALSACSGGGDASTPPTQTVAVTAVSLSTTTQSLNGVGSDFAVQATLQPSNVVGSVTWSSDNAAVATVTASGLSATVHAVSAGTTRVIARSGAIEGAVNITVVPIVRNIAFSLDTLRVAPLATSALVLTVNADAGANTSVTYASSANTIATVSATGLVTAVAPGTASITVTSLAFPAVTATLPVKVSLPVVTVGVTPTNPSVVAGATRQLTAIVTAATGISTDVTWSSSASAVATVSTAGLVTAIAAGQATITATSVANTTSSGSTVVTVTPPTVRTVALVPTTANVFVGATKALVPSIDADVGANTTLTWSSSAPLIASVSATGLVTGIAVGGPVTITATSVLVPAVKATAQITIAAIPAATNFIVTRLGTSPYLSGYGAFALQSTSVNSFLLGVGTETSGLMYSNALLQMSNGTLQLVTPACCTTGGIPSSIAAQSPTEAFVAFSGDPFIAHVAPRIFHQAGSAFIDVPLPAPVAVSQYDRIATVKSVGNGVYNAIANTGALFRYELGVWSPFGTLGGGAQFPTLSSFVSWQRDSVIAAYCLNGTDSDTPMLVRSFNGVQSTVPGFPGTCRTLKGVRSDSLYAATVAGLAVWNGVAWRVVTAGLSAGDSLFDATMCGPTRYAVSRNGNVYSNTGNTLTRVATDGEAVSLADGTRFITAIDCAPDGTLRVASGGSLVARRSGSTWIEENFAPTTRAVNLGSATSGYMVGDGVVYQWNGSAWQMIRRTVSTRETLGSVYTEPSGGMLAVGSTHNDNTNGKGYSVRYSNGVFTTVSLPDFTDLGTLAGVGNGVAYSIGSRQSTGAAVLKYDSGSWSEITTLGSGATVVGASAADNVLALGANYGRRFNGTAWNTIAGPSFSPTVVQVLNPSFAMAAACNGSLSQVQIFNGTTWSSTVIPSSVGVTCVLSLFGTASTDMYALVYSTASSGSTQKIIRWNGASWSEVSTTDLSLLTAGSSVPGLTVLSGMRGAIAIGAAPGASGLRSMQRTNMR